MSCFNVARPLYKNGWSWLAVGVPLVIACIMIFYISHINDLYPTHWTLLAIETFYKYQKIPLAVASLVFPLMAIVVATHRSALILQQIKTTEYQNTFANFMKHREEFFKLLDKLEDKFNCSFENRSHLYKLIFPKNSTIYFDVRMHPNQDGEMALPSFKRRVAKISEEYSDYLVELYLNHPSIEPESIDLRETKHYYDQLDSQLAGLGIIFKNNDENAEFSIGRKTNVILPYKKERPNLMRYYIGLIYRELCYFCQNEDDELLIGTSSHLEEQLLARLVDSFEGKETEQILNFILK